MLHGLPKLETVDKLLQYRRRSKMEMLKEFWNYALDVGNELIPKKRYAFALGLLVALAGSWMLFG